MTNAAPGLGLGGMVEGYCGYSERSLRPVCRRELAVPRVVLVVGFGDPLLVVDAAGHDSGRRLPLLPFASSVARPTIPARKNRASAGSPSAETTRACASASISRPSPDPNGSVRS